MSKLIEEAVKVLRELPDNVQAAVARAIIDYGAGHDDDSDSQSSTSATWAIEIQCDRR